MVPHGRNSVIAIKPVQILEEAVRAAQGEERVAAKRKNTGGVIGKPVELAPFGDRSDPLLADRIEAPQPGFAVAAVQRLRQRRRILDRHGSALRRKRRDRVRCVAEKNRPVRPDELSIRHFKSGQ